jgi:nucleoside-diphosphate-sugar epimerase
MPIALVMGAGGFIGRRLSEKLCKSGWQVRGTFRSMKINRLNAEGFKAFDIGLNNSLGDWTKMLAGVDTVVHLADQAGGANEKITSPCPVDVRATESLALMASKAKIGRFIYISTIKVNGEGSTKPYTEYDLPIPEDAYGISKWEAEKKLKAISDDTGLDVVVLRSPIVYGPGVTANFLNLLKLVDRGIFLPFRSISNRRSLIYLDNIADAIMTCMIHPEAAGRTFLLSDGRDVSTPELIHLIAAAMGKKPLLLPCPDNLLRAAGRLLGLEKIILRLTDSLFVDSSSITEALDWKPPISMEQGIRETVAWYCSR